MLHESEIMERAALEDLHEAATSDQVTALGLRGFTMGSAFVSIAARLPPSAIVINRVLGLGLGKPADRETVEAVISAYQNEPVGQYFIQIHPDAGPPELAGWLEREGLVRGRAWQKFSRGPEPVEAASTDLAVHEIGPEYGKAFGEIVCAGFDLGDQAVPWLAHLPGREGWHIFMSFDGHESAGAGAMFVWNDLAWLDFAATLPTFRCRGSQGAVMESRLRRALELGCRRMFACTGVDVPGDPQHSYKNILKAGFRENYVRENYAPLSREQMLQGQ